MGVVLGTLVPFAVLCSSTCFGANSHFWLLFEPRVRRKYMSGAFMMGCSLGGSGPGFRSIPKKFLGGSASSKGAAKPLFGLKEDAAPSGWAPPRPQVTTGGRCEKARRVQN